MGTWEDVLKITKDVMIRELTDKEKELIIAEALKTPEGRKELAKAMGGKIGEALEEINLSEKLLFADD